MAGMGGTASGLVYLIECLLDVGICGAEIVGDDKEVIVTVDDTSVEVVEQKLVELLT